MSKILCRSLNLNNHAVLRKFLLINIPIELVVAREHDDAAHSNCEREKALSNRRNPRLEHEEFSPRVAIGKQEVFDTSKSAVQLACEGEN